MPTSATDPAEGVRTLLAFAGEGVDAPSAPGRWLLLDGDAVSGRGDAGDAPPAASRTLLAVPGDQVAIHWLDLSTDLAPAQAAAAARLMLAGASAEPLAELHVAVGRAERGLTPAALVPAELVAAWLAAAAEAGLDPDAIIPSTMLLAPPQSGFVRRDRGALADFRAFAAAFAVEPELAEALVGDAPVAPIGQAEFEAALGAAVAAPALDLRQGPFARRRQWRVDRPRLRRLAISAIALALLTLVVQVATILSYTFAADRLQARADALAVRNRGASVDAGPAFGAFASLLFDAVRATPNAELGAIDYRPDGSLVATVTADNPATLSALQGRLEAGGVSVMPGESRTEGGRMTARLTLGPA